MRRWASCALVLALLLIGGCFRPCVPPIASFTFCPDGWRGQLDVQFVSTSMTTSNHTVVFYAWDFGDGETTNDYGGWISHHYDVEGTYKVRLEVTDDRGLKATTEQTIEVVAPAAIENVILSSHPVRVTGEIRNRSEHFLYSVTVKVKFYDADEIRIGEATVDVQGIDPGERVRFSVDEPASLDVASSVRAAVQSYYVECLGEYPRPTPVTN